MQARRSMVGRRYQWPPSRPAPPGPSSLAPPWAPAAAAVAILVTAVLSALVWHSTRLPELDASVEQLLGSHSGEWEFRLATDVANGEPSPLEELWPRPSSRGWPCGGGTRSPLP